MTTTTTYTIPKVRKGTNLPYFGLSTISFLIPFNYINTSDVVVAMRGNLNDTSAKDDVLLIEGTNYSLNGSMLTIDEQSLNLDATDSLDVVLMLLEIQTLTSLSITLVIPLRRLTLTITLNNCSYELKS